MYSDKVDVRASEGLAMNLATTGEGFRRLFDNNYRPVAAYVRRRVFTEHLQDDVVSEVFAIAWKKRITVQSLSNPLPWLYLTARNVIANQTRGIYRQKRLISKAEHNFVGFSGAADPSEVITGTLSAAFAAIDEQSQEVLRLLAWEELTYSEMAEVLECSENAVRIRVHRARAKLASSIDQIEGEAND